MLGPPRPPAAAWLVGVLGMALTGLGMEYFLLRFDDSHPLQQGFWFCLMLLAPLGPALYCFFWHSRSEVLRSCVERVPETWDGEPQSSPDKEGDDSPRLRLFVR
jgi:hypothetical protein